VKRARLTPPVAIPAADARRLLMAGLGLHSSPDQVAPGPARLKRLVRDLGFVQVDTINVLDRAHDLIIWTRLPGYDRPWLTELLESDRALFEHWTHDASLIPVEFFPYWRHRFAAHAPNRWLLDRMGAEWERTRELVLARIRAEGPLMSRDFEHARPPGQNGAWWGWKPQKAALEHLWRRGDLMIAGRRNFQKIYDLTERVIPARHLKKETPDRPALVDWACRSALTRLGLASPSEIGAFWRTIKLPEARAWCKEALKRGEVEQVLLADASPGLPPRKVYALANWKRRLHRVEVNDSALRLLCPFDPLVRDRARLQRLFAFDYRFEAFTPGSQRKFGYYVMPILDGDRIVGRFDPKLHRTRKGDCVLEIKGLWWEKGARPTRALRSRFYDSAEQLARFVGARRVEFSS